MDTIFTRFPHFRFRSILPLARSAPSLQNASGGAPIGARLYLNSPVTGVFGGSKNAIRSVKENIAFSQLYVNLQGL